MQTINPRDQGKPVRVRRCPAAVCPPRRASRNAWSSRESPPAPSWTTARVTGNARSCGAGSPRRSPHDGQTGEDHDHRDAARGCRHRRTAAQTRHTLPARRRVVHRDLRAVAALGAATGAANAGPLESCTRTSGTVVAVDFGDWGGDVVRGWPRRTGACRHRRAQPTGRTGSPPWDRNTGPTTSTEPCPGSPRRVTSKRGSSALRTPTSAPATSAFPTSQPATATPSKVTSMPDGPSPTATATAKLLPVKQTRGQVRTAVAASLPEPGDGRRRHRPRVGRSAGGRLGGTGPSAASGHGPRINACREDRLPLTGSK